MRHFLLYHNPEGMGYDFDGNPVDTDESDYNTFEAYTDGPNWADWSRSASNPQEEWDWRHPESGKVFQIDDSAQRIVTSNKKEVGDCIGQQVWIIQGEVGTSPGRYWLHGYFYPEGYLVSPTPQEGKRFKYLVYGRKGEIHTMDSAIEITSEPWFLAIRRLFKNFRVGFRELKDTALIAHLEDALGDLRKNQEA